MNKTNIEWTDYTWNPITGCTHGCSFCYARRIAYRLRGRCGYWQENPFQPTFHPNRLGEPAKITTPSRIFTCSMGDLFDPNVPEDWHDRVIEVIRACPQHTFQVLTKQPRNLYRMHYPANLWMGVSVCQNADTYRIDWLREAHVALRFVSFEPLLEAIPFPNLQNIDWVIIGGLTGPKPMTPHPQWVVHLLEQADAYGIPVFVKENAGYWERLHEFPKEAGQA